MQIGEFRSGRGVNADEFDAISRGVKSVVDVVVVVVVVAVAVVVVVVVPIDLS